MKWKYQQPKTNFFEEEETASVKYAGESVYEQLHADGMSSAEVGFLSGYLV